MDLFEYEDVAQSYELWTDPQPRDLIDFHLGYAKEYGQGGILDIACGTGAVTLPLLQAGYDVTGLDLSQPMLDILKGKLVQLSESQRAKCRLVQADMRNFRLGQTFPLAFIARSGFIHLPTPQDQRKTLLSIHSHLSEKGILVFNIFDPNYEMIFKDLKGKASGPFPRFTYTNAKSNQEKVFNDSVHDPATQLVEVLWTWEEYDPTGKLVSRRERTLRCRWTFRQEMEYLLELTGFKVLNLYGGYGKEAFSPGIKHSIWVCQKNEPARSKEDTGWPKIA